MQFNRELWTSFVLLRVCSCTDDIGRGGVVARRLVDWNLGSCSLPTTTRPMTPFRFHTPIMMLVATGSLSRLAELFMMSEQSGTLPVYSPNGGVTVS